MFNFFNELIKALRKADLSDEDIDVVDAARQSVRADETQPTPETQGKLAKLWNNTKDLVDFSNNSLSLVTAITPLLPQLLDSLKAAIF